MKNSGAERLRTPMDRRKLVRYNTRSSVSRNVLENTDTLPIDLIIEILLRLPAKSIAICRCVSKEWSSLLRRPQFTDSFLISSSSQKRLLFTIDFCGKWLFFSSPQPLNSDESLSVVAADYHMSFSGDMVKNMCLFANGFTCHILIQMLKGKTVRVPVICNPCTGQLLPLPRVRARNVDLRSFFGYDSIEKQFKVLCMTVTTYRGQTSSKEHQVLTLGKGKMSWRKIECLFLHIPLRASNGICVNGVLYYLAHSNTTTNLIACFDVRSEKFSFIEMELYISDLINYKGKLGVVLDDGGGHAELWIRDDTEKDKWSKQIFDLPIVGFENRKSIWATDTGELGWVLRCRTSPFYVFYYNLERASVRRVEIKGIEEKLWMDGHRLAAYFTVTDHVENVMFL